MLHSFFKPEAFHTLETVPYHLSGINNPSSAFYKSNFMFKSLFLNSKHKCKHFIRFVCVFCDNKSSKNFMFLNRGQTKKVLKGHLLQLLILPKYKCLILPKYKMFVILFSDLKSPLMNNLAVTLFTFCCC